MRLSNTSWQSLLLFAITVAVAAGAEAATQEAPPSAMPAQPHMLAQASKGQQQGEQQLLQGNQAVLGKVEAVTSDQIKVNIGEVQPRFLPLAQAKEKNFPDIKAGDDLIIIVNGQNLIVDYHPLDFPSSSHRIVRGQIASNMPIGHDKVVVKQEGGKEESFEVRSQVRSKIASIPVGTPAVFLIDETNQVADGTFANMQAVKEAHKQPENKSPIKGANRQVDGTVVEPLRADKITIKTGEGERPFEVREVIHDKIAKLAKGDSVILLVDNENKVVDVAIPPHGHGH